MVKYTNAELFVQVCNSFKLLKWDMALQAEEGFFVILGEKKSFWKGSLSFICLREIKLMF